MAAGPRPVNPLSHPRTALGPARSSTHQRGGRSLYLKVTCVSPQRPISCDQGVPGRSSAGQRALHPQREHQVTRTPTRYRRFRRYRRFGVCVYVYACLCVFVCIHVCVYMCVCVRLTFSPALRWLLRTEMGSFITDYFQVFPLFSRQTRLADDFLSL